MNPISLTLKNFRSYKSETISFEHDGVMPIVGKNGHGKSSAFYAILLALYGKVPIDNVEVPVKELVTNDGSKDMAVTFAFFHEEKRYRVERAYRIKKTKAGVEKCDQVKCEFYQLVDEQEIRLSAKEKKVTGEKIVKVIGKGCDNFCNSAFFPQSEENRLARLKPSELIEEIARLKGVTIWEALREKAKKALDLVKIDLQGIETYAEEAKQEISTLPEVEERLALISKTVEETKSKIQEQEEKLSSIQQDKSQVEALVKAAQEIRNSLLALEGDIKREQESLAIFQSQVSAAQAIVARKEEVQGKYNELKESEKEKTLLDKNSRERSDLMVRVESLAGEIREAEQVVRAQFQDVCSRQRNAASAIMAGEDYERQLAEVQAILEAAMASEQSITNKQQENQNIGSEITKLEMRNQQLLGLISEETGKINDLIQKGTCGECERPIDEHGAEQIRQHKSGKIQNWSNEGNANEQAIANYRAQISQNNEFISVEQQKAGAKNEAQITIGRLQAGIDEARKANEEMVHLEAECRRLQDVVDSGQFSEKVPELENLKTQLNGLYYDSEHHQEVSTKVEGLLEYGRLYQQLGDAEATLPAFVSQLNSIKQGIEEKQTRTDQLREQLASTNLIELENKVQILQSDFEEITIDMKNNKRELDSQLQSLGAEQKQVERIEEKKKALEVKLGESEELLHKQYLYERAIEMYSKSGIPTLIIESLIPGIEAEANALLREMKADKAISFERHKRADGTFQDKIVIMVRDRRAAKRSFNTFSGAECFQISFALRVAICGSDDIMFIDEGFGKLDPENLNTIVSTLNSLKDKFKKIIIISHLKELIDMFDVRLAIALGAKGYSTAKWITA